MKKVLFAFVVMLLAASNHASAQVFFGPQAGFNYATLTGTDFSMSPKIEWHAGLMVDFGTKHISLQPSLLYSRRGYKYDYETYTTTVVSSDTTLTTYVSANVDAALGYIDIPVMLNVFFGERQGLMLQAGPQLSILITDKSVATSVITTSTNGGSPQTTQPETETEVKFNATDVSLMAGLGYKFPKLLLVYLRASTGFGKVQDNSTIVRDGNEGRHLTFEIGAALTFGAK